MDKTKIIAIISIFVIVGVVSFSFLNIYALENLELNGTKEVFRFFEMSNGDEIRICNNSPIPANFNQFNVIIFYENEVLGTYVVNAASIMPNSVLDIEGNYVTDSFAESQSTFMLFDHMLSGASVVRADPRKMAVQTQFQTTMIGIPYSVMDQYSGIEFWNMLNEDENLKCQ